MLWGLERWEAGPRSAVISKARSRVWGALGEGKALGAQGRACAKSSRASLRIPEASPALVYDFIGGKQGWRIVSEAVTWMYFLITSMTFNCNGQIPLWS